MKNVMLSGEIPKRNIYVEIIASILLIFFVHTLISSYIQFQSLKNLLAFYINNTTIVAWLIIISELAIAILLFIPKTRHIGFLSVLLSALYAGYIILSKPEYPHAFGGILNNLTPKQHLITYCLILIFSIAGFWLDRKKRKYKSSEESQTIIFT